MPALHSFQNLNGPTSLIENTNKSIISGLGFRVSEKCRRRNVDLISATE